MISTPEVSRRANIQNLEGAFISILDNVYTPAVGTREDSCKWAETKYPEMTRVTPTIASDKYYRNWNVLGQTDTILANNYHGLMLFRS